MARLTLGLDYGTNSVRGLLVDVDSADEVASAVAHYVSGDSGILLDSANPNVARQVPADYLMGFFEVCHTLSTFADMSQVIGIGVDTTGSSPMPVDSSNQSLSESPEFRENLGALCWLWKDHSAAEEAAEITRLIQEMDLPYLRKCGGTYSSEWFWSKILRCARTDPDLFAKAYSWVEICDWIPSQLCGITDPAKIKRSRCAAGHKAMFEDDWSGLPSREFLAQLHPQLGELRSRLYETVTTSDQPAGSLDQEYSAKTGLRVGIPVAVGAFDAHFGAVASAVTSGTLVKIMGTSTCDCMVHPLSDQLPEIPGLCGVVKGSILPGYYGLEAGQSAVGDIFNWVSRLTGRSHDQLTSLALNLVPGESGLLMLDWHNGNRTILVDPLLSGLIVGLSLYTQPHEIYRSVIEATAFGSLRIIERIEEYGVKVDRVVICGGIAEKSPLTMQIYADVLNRSLFIAKSNQTCALGSAIFAAVVAGAFPDVEKAQQKMAGLKELAYHPQPSAVRIYRELYQLYREMHDAFGMPRDSANLFGVMKALRAIKERGFE